LSKAYLTINRESPAPATTPALRSLLRRAAALTLETVEYPAEGEISMLLTGARHIQELNREWRNIDKPTDVLSFPLQDDPWELSGRVVLGDVVINTERCAAQAAELGHGYQREMVFLLIHSILHLLGWDHERSKDEEEEMFALQREIIGKIDFPEE